MKAKKLRDFVETAVTDMKGQNVVIMDIAKLSSFADYMLVTPNIEVINFDPVAEPEVSDHRALLLDLR